MKNINKFIVYCLLTLSIISGYFIIAYKKAFASEIPSMIMDESFIETWLFPIFSINSEWSTGQAGTNIKNASEIQAGTDNISYSTDFNNAYSYAYNINNVVDPFDLTDADEFYGAYFAQSVDYNKFVLQKKVEDIQDYLTSQQAQDLKDFLLDPDVCEELGYNTIDGAWVNSVICTTQLGGQTIIAAFDQAGNWLGSKFDNILTSVQQLTQPDVTFLNSYLKNTYPQSDASLGIYGPLHTITMQSGATEKNQNSWYLNDYFSISGKFQFDKPCFFYTEYNSTQGFSSLCCVYDYSSQTTPIVSDVIRTNLTKNTSISATSYNWVANELFIINGITYRKSVLTLTYPSGANTGLYLANFFSDTTYSSLQDIKDYISENIFANSVDTTIPPYSVELVDEQNVPYVVPDVRGLATTIDHIYPALDKLDDAILTIPSELADVISLVDTIPATIAEDIADIIADAIRDAISIPDILTEEATADPNPEPDPDPDNPLPEYPPELPSWFWPTLFPDIFDFKGLEIFKPIFDIVGNNYSMYQIWVMIPAIIIFVVIIYFIISVL